MHHNEVLGLAQSLKQGFSQIEAPGFATTLRELVTDHAHTWNGLSQRIERPPKILDGYPQLGRAFGRVDWARYEGCLASDDRLDRTARSFERTGLNAAALAVANGILSEVTEVVGQEVEYDRVFLLTYGQGDFVDPHGATQTRSRCYLQLPISLGCVGSIRVLRDGWMCPFVDGPATVRLLMPGCLHEVPPVLGHVPDEAVRIVISLRFAWPTCEG